MKHYKVFKKWILIAFAIGLTVLTACAGENSDTGQPLDEILQQTAEVLMDTTATPAYGSVCGDWVAFGLARWGGEVPEGWYDAYESAVENAVIAGNGVLSDRKYTEYSRVILALTAMGKDPTNVGGYNLILPLADYEQTIFQGINGPIYALLALDSGNYTIPENLAVGMQATREQYVEYILSKESAGGGWSLAGGEAEVDITAMALQALAKYCNREDVSAAVDRAVQLLSEKQNPEGGYTAYDADGSESVSQVIVALTELGISIQDNRFVKNGNTLLDRLLDFRTETHGFQHTLDGEMNQIATEQAFYALVALYRAEQKRPSLYNITEADTTVTDIAWTCTISISCATILDNMDTLNKEKQNLVPADGWILEPMTVTFREGESVFDVLLRVCREQKIHMEFMDTPMYNSAYIEGIANLYELDCGARSGWMFQVNDWFPNYGCSRYALQDGDTVCWVYTCDLGADVGNDAMQE